MTTLRIPKRFMKAAENGPIRPNSPNRTARANEMSAFDQPNSACSGSIITPAEPKTPAVASIVRKVAIATAQP
jgi:hypothetical protein